MSFLFTITIYLFIYQIRGDFELLILHNNDLRGRIEEYVEHSGRHYGGFSRIVQVVKEARQAASKRTGPPVLYLNAGDVYTDPVWRNTVGSRLITEFLNMLQPNASGFGEHDLDQIYQHLYPFVQKIKHPLVVANIHFRNYTYLTNALKPSVVLKMGKRKIGVIGYVSSSQSYLALTDGRIYLEDEIVALRRESKKLKNDRVDVIIALGYSGYSTDKKIAFQVKDIDVVIGGMSNTLLWNGPKPNTETIEGTYPTLIVQPSGKKVPVVQTYGFAKYIGRLTLKFDNFSNLLSYDGNAIFLDRKIPHDIVTLKMLNSYQPTLREIDADEVLFRTSIPLSAENASMSESNLANFVTDCILEYVTANTKLKPSAMVVLNAGAFKGKINTSKENPNVTRKILAELIPCNDMLLAFDVPGAYLIKTLEINANNLEHHGMIRTAGMRYIYDMSRTGNLKVLSARSLCLDCPDSPYQDIYDHYLYSVITTENAFKSAEEFDVLRRKAINKRSVDATLMDIVLWKRKVSFRFHPQCDERTQKYDRRKAHSTNARTVDIKSTLHILILFILITNMKYIFS